MGHSSNRNYWKDWAASIRDELARQGLILNEEQFGGVYYYDLVPGPKERKAHDEGIIQIQILGLKKKAEEELSSLRSPFTKNLGIIRKLSDAIVDNFGDIFTYLYLDKTYQAVNERIYEAIDNSKEQVILIGYSLGSIVSFCALMQNQVAAEKVAHLLMLGSPLFWFKQGVARHVDLGSRPAVGRFINIAGILDIAWPQMVPGILSGLDDYVEFTINPFNPVKGHRDYFYQDKSRQVISAQIIKGWV